MIKAIMSLFLCILGLFPAVIITAIAFVINPIFGVIVALYFIAVIIIGTVCYSFFLYYKKHH